MEWGTGEVQMPTIKSPPEPPADSDRHEQFAAVEDEAASLRSMVGNRRQDGGGFFTGEGVSTCAQINQ